MNKLAIITVLFVSLAAQAADDRPGARRLKRYGGPNSNCTQYVQSAAANRDGALNIVFLYDERNHYLQENLAKGVDMMIDFDRDCAAYMADKKATQDKGVTSSLGNKGKSLAGVGSQIDRNERDLYKMEKAGLMKKLKKAVAASKSKPGEECVKFIEKDTVNNLSYAGQFEKYARQLCKKHSEEFSSELSTFGTFVKGI